MNLNQNNLVGIKLPTSLWVNLNNEAIYREVERDHLTVERADNKGFIFCDNKINTVINKNSGRFIA